MKPLFQGPVGADAVVPCRLRPADLAAACASQANSRPWGGLMGDQLWVPLDAEEGTVVIALNGLDHSVRRPRHRT